MAYIVVPVRVIVLCVFKMAVAVKWLNETANVITLAAFS